MPKVKEPKKIGRPKKVIVVKPKKDVIDYSNPSGEQLEKVLLEKLPDRMWRLTSGKLYFIKDKEGNKLPFIPNAVQKDFLDNMHTKNVILKARQHGMTTLINIIALDKAQYDKYQNCGVIAQDLETANDIFDNKIKFAYDNQPDWIKDILPLKIEKKGYITFSANDSRISVDNSFRSGTLQHLHISEYGPTCAQYPEKAREIRTGAMNTVSPTGEIYVESTAAGNSGHFYNLCQEAMQKELSGKPLSNMDYKFFFYPWFLEPLYTLNDKYIPIKQETENYFESIRGEAYFASHYKGYQFREGQKRWYQEKSREQGDDMKREYPTTPDEAFENAIQGAYYLKECNLTVEQKRLCRVSYDPKLKVCTAWDIGGAGGGDDTAIWFYQKFGRELRLIDYWEGNGYSMAEIINNVINDKNYNYDTHYLPHDAKVTEYTTGETRYDTAIKLINGNVVVLEKLSVADGINAVRTVFSSCYFDETNCSGGFSHLSQYSRSWDKTNGQFRDKPNHNQHSNGADAFRYFAMACNRDTINLGTVRRPMAFQSWLTN